MRNQIQQSPFYRLVQIAGRGLFAVALYYPNYIYGGVAIHGNPSVPAHPASHGCVRIPMFAAREFSEIATIGMVVIVYEGDPLAKADAVEIPVASIRKITN